jgi:uncharacterized membrane protein HdeD (DUF308 family)
MAIDTLPGGGRSFRWSGGPMVSRAATNAAWSDITPLVSRGALTLGFVLVTILLQIIALLIPGVAAAVLLLVFAAFVALDGVVTLGILWFGRLGGGARPVLLLRCVLALAMAGVTLAGPIVAGAPSARLATLLAIWAMLNGLLDLAAGLGVFGAALQRWLVVVGGVSVAVGVVLLVSPPTGMLALMWWITGYGVVYGGVTLAIAWRSGG